MAGHNSSMPICIGFVLRKCVCACLSVCALRESGVGNCWYDILHLKVLFSLAGRVDEVFKAPPEFKEIIPTGQS